MMHRLGQIWARYGWDLSAVALALPFIGLILIPGLPTPSDADIHFHRMVAAAFGLEQGTYPRWTSYLHHGFGYPFLNFYAPGAYLLGGGVWRLTGLPLELIFKLMLIGATILYPLGAYRWARIFAPPRAALVAAAIYLYAPLRLRELLVQVNLPQYVAFALLPWLMWSVGLAVRRPTTWALVRLALFVAALIFSHQLTAFIGLPVVGLYALWAGGRRRERRRALTIVVGGLALGLVLSAIYWLPALTELSYTQINTIQDATYDVEANFVSSRYLLSAGRPIDQSWINWADASGPLGPRLGEPALIMATLSLLALLWLRGYDVPQRPVVVVACIGLLFSLYLTNDASLIIWRSVPFLGYIQFPWRLLGISLLLVVPLAAFVIRSLPERLNLPLAYLTIGLTFFAVWPLMYAPVTRQSLPASPTPADGIEYERTTGNLGLAASNEYLPLWAETRPIHGLFVGDPPRITRIERGEWFIDLDEQHPLPPDVIVEALPNPGSQTTAYRVTAPATTLLVFHQLFFPGWQATLNGAPVVVTPIAPHGLIGVEVPAGQHTLYLSLGLTSAQALGTLISGLALLGALGLGIVAWRRRRPQGLTVPVTPARHWPATLAGVCLLFTVVDGLILHPHTTLFRPSTPAGQNPAPVALNVTFDEILHLAGYQVSARTALPGSTIDLTLYWQARTPLETAYRASAQITGRDGVGVYAQADAAALGGLGPSRWRTDGYVVDRYRLTLTDDAPPFASEIRLVVYAPTADGPRYLTADDGATNLVIAPLAIVGDYVRLPAEQFIPTEAEFGEDIQMRGWAWSVEDPACLWVRWHVVRRPVSEYAILLHLSETDAASTPPLSVQDTAPFSNLHPTSAWYPGQQLDDQYCLEEVPDSRTVRLGLYDRQTGVRLPARLAGQPQPEDVIVIPFPSDR